MNNSSLSSEGHVYALDVLSEIGVVKALADIHLHGMSKQDQPAELRGVVYGAYRTVALGGALASRWVQLRGGAKEEISDAYWSFVNESSIRGIAVSICEALLPIDTSPPVGILKHEFQFLFPRGYEIGNLHANGEVEKAFALWRETMKAEAQINL